MKTTRFPFFGKKKNRKLDWQSPEIEMQTKHIPAQWEFGDFGWGFVIRFLSAFIVIR